MCNPPGGYWELSMPLQEWLIFFCAKNSLSLNKPQIKQRESYEEGREKALERWGLLVAEEDGRSL